MSPAAVVRRLPQARSPRSRPSRVRRRVGALGAAGLLALLTSVGATAEAGAGRTTASAPVASTQAADRARLQQSLEDEVLALTNAERRAHGCSALRLDRRLRKAARRHTIAMARAGVMSHQLPGEVRFSLRITRAGYTRWRRVAENVARGFDSAQQVVDAWMNSPSHRRNILNCQLDDLGVGVVLQGGQLWWTQDFGTR